MEAGTMIRTLEESRDFFAADRFAMEACGITIDEVTQQGARCSMPLTPMHLNAGGVAQGGAVYTLCDTTFAVAANACGTLTVSQCADMHYLRPGTGERLFAEAICVSAGRSTCLYRVEVTDGAGALVAVCMVTGIRRAPVNKA